MINNSEIKWMSVNINLNKEIEELFPNIKILDDLYQGAEGNVAHTIRVYKEVDFVPTTSEDLIESEEYKELLSKFKHMLFDAVGHTDLIVWRIYPTAEFTLGSIAIRCRLTTFFRLI